NHVEFNRERRVAVVVGLERKHIPGVPVRRGRMRVRLSERVEMPSRAHAVARAAIALLVDVEAVLLPGLEAADIRNELDLVALLGEGGRAFYAAVLVRLQRRFAGEARPVNVFVIPHPATKPVTAASGMRAAVL